jgi:type IV pilus assembly protein PilC
MGFGAWLSGASTVFAAIGGVVILVALVALVIPSARVALGSYFNQSFGHRGIFGNIAASRFTSAMVLSLASGLDTSEAVTMAAGLSGTNKVLEEKNQKCLDLLQSGGTLANAMLQAGLLTARNSRMLSLGARSGMADSAMAEIASRSERDVQLEIDSLVGRIEPTMVIITSVIVGIILLAVMLPLMGIMTSIG